MRAGGCTVQQTLTSEAASVLKHSLSLARRRGHAQVTPLHVAATLLSSRVSLLRRACLKSHPHSSSHPLQCRALELCFNVALNRLPTSPSPLLHGQPSLSNALIAALKRAQAHQRRGCIEQQQQQPLLAIKVELEQLIISILDDPSVSRVMREAGFSSTNVKNNLEDSSVSSVFQCYSTSNPNSITSSEAPHTSFWQTHFLNCSSEQNPVFFSTPKKILLSDSKEEDLRLVLEVLGRKKRRNTVIVGDSVSATEGLVAELMGRVERGEVPEELKSAHFIKFQFPAMSLRFMKREDVDVKVADLRRKVGSLVSGGGAIIYAGDLKWTVDASDHGGFSLGDHVPCYSPVDHLVAEIGRLLFEFSCSNSKIWLVATANYQTYMRCQMKQPSLEIRWSLQAVSVPSSGLGLSVHGSSGLDSKLSISQNPSQMLEIKPFAAVKEEQDKLSCCAECTSNFEKDAVFLKSGQQKHSTLVNSCVKDMNKVSTDLPYWLQPHRADKDDLAELRRKWNRLCHSLHHSRSNQMRWSPQLFNNQSLSSKSYNSWWPIGSQCNQNNRYPDSSSISFADPTLKTNHTSDSAIQLGSQQPRLVEFGLGNGTQKNNVQELSLGCLKNTENTDEKITLALGTSLFSEKEKGMEELQKLLQENVPWQCEATPSISKALLDPKASKKNGTWLLIQGDDWMGKRRLARAIVESFGGSGDQLVHMNMRTEDQPNPCQTLGEALRKDRKCVVLIEGIDFADTQFLKFLSDGYNDSNSEESLGRELSFSQAMFILTTGANEERRGTSDGIIHMKFHIEDSVESGHKRKAEWDSPKESKYQRTSDEEDSISSIKQSEKVFSRQSSSNTLDLNILAEEEEDNNKSETDNFRSVSSDPDQKLLNGFLKSIKNRFVFNRNSAQLGQMTESFVSKLKGSFEEVLGGGMGGCFSVDQLVLEEMVNMGSGFFLASLFEKWLKDIFQTSLQMVKNGGKDKAIRLSFGGKVEEESAVEVGYMGSNLPKTIQVDLKE